jgi:uncharacterized protein YukE
MSTQITPTMLTHAATTARDAGGSVSRGLTALLTTIQTDGAAVMKGGAGTAFQTVSAQLNEELGRLLTALGTMADNVDATNRSTGSADDGSAQAIGAVGTQLSPSGTAAFNFLNG